MLPKLPALVVTPQFHSVPRVVDVIRFSNQTVPGEHLDHGPVSPLDLPRKLLRSSSPFFPSSCSSGPVSPRVLPKPWPVRPSPCPRRPLSCKLVHLRWRQDFASRYPSSQLQIRFDPTGQVKEVPPRSSCLRCRRRSAERASDRRRLRSSGALCGGPNGGGHISWAIWVSVVGNWLSVSWLSGNWESIEWSMIGCYTRT